MATSLLTASSSWYSSRICDALPSGLLCYGGSNSLYVFDVSGASPKYKTHLAAHNTRVSSVSLCRHGERMLCCSSAEDGKVRVHDLETKKVIHEHVKHKGVPTVVNWSTVDAKLIVSADDRGGILVWRIGQSDPWLMLHENAYVTTLACSPHDSDLLAVGYKTGSILLVDLSRGGAVLQRLRGHDEEIQGLCWAPELGEDRDFGNAKKDMDAPDDDDPFAVPTGCLVASGSRDRTVRVWSSINGRCVQTLRLPQSTGHWRGGGGGKDDKVKLWVAVHWPVFNKLLSSGFNGDLLSWDLSLPAKNKSTAFSSGSLHKGHQRIVFTICTTGEQRSKVITSGMDRQHLVWDLSNLTGLSAIPSLGGFAYCLAQSPINPGRLAIGCGDNLIRVWSVDKPDKPLEVQSFWQGIRSKVTAVSWHPEKEGLLAYGTDDGRVGIYNVFNNKNPLVSSTYHRHVVYVVSWGPAVGEKAAAGNQSGLSLYSVGDGTILQHRPLHLEDKATNINDVIIKTNQIEGRVPVRSEMSWKADFTAVAIGNDDGSIELLRPPDLACLCVIHVHNKLINVIRWHPEHTASDPGHQPSPYRHWLAAGSNESRVHVVNVEKAVEGPVPAVGSAPVIVQSDRVLEGHSHRLTGLCWSPHHQARLASASFDNTAQVWDVLKSEPLANFRGHNGRVLTVQWSELEPDLLYTGAQDNTVQAWRMSQQTNKHPPDASYHEKKKFSKPKGKGKGSAADKDKESKEKGGGAAAEVPSQMQEFEQLLEQRKREIAAEKMEQQSSPEIVPSAKDQIAEEKINELLGRKKVGLSPIAEAQGPETAEQEVTVFEGYKDAKKVTKKKRPKALWSKSNNTDNRGKVYLQQDCLDLLPYTVNKKEGTSDVLPASLMHMGHFVNRKSTLQLIDTEVQHHEESNSLEQHMILDMFKGDLASSLKAAAEKEQLTDWHMGLAASVSPTFWRDLCGKFAAQSEKNGNYQKSVTYHLAKNDVYGAINMLKRNNLYKDAACLGQVRLLKKDPALKQIYQDWAESAIQESSYEQAARCYLTLGQPLEAAKMLMRRSDLTALRAATYVALTSGDLEVTSAYATKFVSQCLLKWDWASAADVISQHECFMVHAITSSVHECVVRQLAALGVLTETMEEAKYYSQQESLQTITQLQNFPVDPSMAVDPLCLWPPHTMPPASSSSTPSEAGDGGDAARGGDTFVHHVLKLWQSTWGVAFDLNSLNALHKKLLPQRRDTSPQTHGRQVLIDVCVEVALGLLKLLVGETEEGLRHWALGLAAALQAGQAQMAIGLCKLLLPQGPLSIPKLLEQISKVYSTLDMTKGSSKLPRPDHTVSVPDLDMDSTNVADSSPTDLTSFQALRAYYAYCVLLDLETETESASSELKVEVNVGQSETETNGKESESETNEKETESETNGVDKDIETETVTADLAKLIVSDSESETVSSSVFRGLSRSLLLDSQLKRCKLEDSFVFIEKAISGLITKHGRVKPEKKESESESNGKLLEDTNEEISERKDSVEAIQRDTEKIVIDSEANGQEKDGAVIGQEDIVLVERNQNRYGEEISFKAVENSVKETTEMEVKVEVHSEKMGDIMDKVTKASDLEECFASCSLMELTSYQKAITEQLQADNPQELPFPTLFGSLEKLVPAVRRISEAEVKERGVVRKLLVQWGKQKAYTQQHRAWLEGAETDQ